MLLMNLAILKINLLLRELLETKLLGNGELCFAALPSPE